MISSAPDHEILWWFWYVWTAPVCKGEIDDVTDQLQVCIRPVDAGFTRWPRWYPQIRSQVPSGVFRPNAKTGFPDPGT